MSIRQHDFTIERRFRQTPAQSFRAFADPALKRRWFGVPEGWIDANWELDFRVGGSEVSVGRDPRGVLHEFRSRYHDIVENERIVFAYDLFHDRRLISVSLTTVEFFADAEGTRLRFTEQGAFFDDLDAARSYRGAADKMLYDARTPDDASRPGGMGLRFDWSLLDGFDHPLPWALSGGLSPDNVAEAARRTGARLVDVSSGVESAPGVKDVDKIAVFLRAVTAL